MQIDIKGSKWFPILLLAIYAFYISVSFTAIEMQMASYLSLAGVILCTAIALFLTIRNKQIHRFDVYVFSFLLCVLSVSIFNTVDWKDWIYTCCALLLLHFSFKYYKAKTKYLLYGALIGFSLPIYFQLFQNITHPEMWLLANEKENTGYLLGGNYNQIGCRILCAWMTSTICLKYSKWFWFNHIPLFVSSIAILSMVQSMTSLSCCILFIVICMLPNVRLQRFCAMSILFCAILFNILVCFQGKGFENNELARWFIIDILNKDMTFSNRTEMWDSALRIINESPIWGHGFVDGDWYKKYMSSFAVGPHNMILAVLINGGVVGLLLFIASFLYSLHRLYSNNTKTACTILITLSIFCIMSLMEIYPFPFIFYILILGVYNKELSINHQ